MAEALECAAGAGRPEERTCADPAAAAAAKARFHAHAWSAPGLSTCDYGAGGCAGKVFDLRPGGIVALDNFVPPKVLRGYQRIFATPYDFEHVINGAMSQEWERDGGPKRRKQRAASEEAGQASGRAAGWETRARVWCPVLRRIRKAAEAHLAPNFTVGGGYRGRFYVDHAMQRRYAGADLGTNAVTPHTDTDFEGRCLSAALYVGDDTRIADRNASGVFQTYTCVSGECHGP